jgi:serine/threonine protein kinase
MNLPLRPEVEAAFAAALEFPASEQSAFLAREFSHDPNLRREVEELLSAFHAAGSFLDPVAKAPSLGGGAAPLPAAIGPYRIHRLLGEGAMGAVYEATQEHPRRAVALKVIKPGLAGSELLRRFELESLALGRLQHPGIAQIYEAGAADSGSGPQPYFAMELIRGESLLVYGAARQLPIRQRLEIMAKVCAAVHHAHQRGIIHRDLKPGNILVDESGQPKILDFGVARLTDADAFATRRTDLGHLVGTLAYMSPEQVLADPLELDTRTDVYSLGVILFELVSGRLPYPIPRHLPQAVQAIREREPAPLGSLDRACRGDIETIAAKALEKDKTRRYGSAADLAADIRRYLNYEPILARPGNPWYRAFKFLRRYRLPVAAAALLFAGLSAGLYVANRERVAAERRFAQLQQLSRNIIDLDKAIRDLPGSTEARQRLVSVSIKYLEGLAADARGNLDLAQELGEGYWRIARIQGVPLELNIGQSAQADASLKKAGAFLDRVLASRPADRNALLRSAVIAHDRMILAQEEHRRADALVDSAKAAAGLDAFLATGNPSEAERREIATAYGNLALAHVNLHLYTQAIPLAHKAIEVARPSPAANLMLTGSYSLLANALRYQGDLDGALQAIREARRFSENALYPTETARMVNLYGTFLREGLILGEDGAPNLGRPEEAVDPLQRAFDMAEAAARRDPVDSTSRSRVGNAGLFLGNILRHTDPSRALAVYDLAIRRLAEIPNRLIAWRDRSLVLANSSYALRSLHQPREARQRIEAALAILRDTNDYPASRIPIDSEAFIAVRAEFHYEAEFEDVPRALAAGRLLLDSVMAAQPDVLNDLRDAPKLSALYEDLAAVYRRAGDARNAEDLQTKRLELWRHWDRKLPHNPFVLRQLAAAR